MAYFVFPIWLSITREGYVFSGTLLFKKPYPRSLIFQFTVRWTNLLALGMSPWPMITNWWGSCIPEALIRFLTTMFHLWLRFIRFEPAYGALLLPPVLPTSWTCAPHRFSWMGHSTGPQILHGACTAGAAFAMWLCGLIWRMRPLVKFTRADRLER
jgi:hypothetical protein